MLHLKLPDLKTNHVIQFIYDAKLFYAKILDLILNSKESIHFQTYIFENDSKGREIIEALKSAASRGVKVYFMVDRLGSMSLKDSIEKELKASGIKFRFFGKFRWLKFFKKEYHIGRRLHHKIMLVDQSKAMISGMNVGEIFLKWFDFAVYLEGNSCQDLYRACIRYWPYRVRRHLKKEQKKNEFAGPHHSRILNNDGFLNFHWINRSYRFYMQNARREVFLISPYFFPGIAFINELIRLKSKGVRIRILSNYLSDVPLIRRAGAFFYDRLMKNGIEIYEWLPTVLHGKAIIIDGKILNVGSYNLNYLSIYTNIELNIEIHSEHLVSDFTETLGHRMNGKIRHLTLENFNKNIFEKIANYLSYKIIRLVSIIHIFFTYSRRMSKDEF